MKRLKLLTVVAILISIQTVSSHLQRTGQAKSETIEKYPSVVHLDGTSRLQEVTEEPHRTLLQEWKKETGCPMLLNTSLNIKGEPIVNTEEDARRFQNNNNITVL